MFRKTRWTMFALALVVGSFTTPAASQAPTGLNPVLTADHLTRLNGVHAMDAVRTLRPLWLRQRGTPMSLGNSLPVRVYLDDLPLGTIETLETIQLSTVVRMQHFSSIEAVRRWGPDHAGGVIHVRTR